MEEKNNPPFLLFSAGQSAAALPVLHLAQLCHALAKYPSCAEKLLRHLEVWLQQGRAGQQPGVGHGCVYTPLTPLNEHIRCLHHQDEGNAAGLDGGCGQATNNTQEQGKTTCYINTPLWLPFRNEKGKTIVNSVAKKKKPLLHGFDVLFWESWWSYLRTHTYTESIIVKEHTTEDKIVISIKQINTLKNPHHKTHQCS